MNIQLRLGLDVVGTAERAFCSDRTWYGLFRPAADMPSRVREFIAFSEEWHERLREQRPCSADEFGPWADIYASTEWRACGPAERVRSIEGPVFSGGEVTWKELSDAEPDAAAGGGET
ncbi:MAG: hypothetical protein JSS02_34190 [Planctomycetes bacterium]|nr:hypothetical protein [Planctomycetota bacterium]